MTASGRWTNWVGNQTCTPARRLRPASEADAIAATRDALAAGLPLRVAATGHSFTPVCLTDGALLELGDMHGVVAIDGTQGRATVLAGTTIEELGPALWAEGLALHNQGDIHEQQIAGAVSTGTHGSGVTLRSFSGNVTALRLVTASGDVLDVDEREPELLHAAQVAVGMLGVITRVQVQAVSAYRLRERIEQRAFEDVLGAWDALVAGHRHFSFFWLPTESSAALYGLETPPGVPVADTCYVKIYDEVGPDVPDDATPGARVDRSYRIYPGVFEPNFHELEYFVPLERGPEALRAMRELMLARQPDAIFPMEVRTMAGDPAWLSGAHGGPAAVISVSGVPGTDHGPYLRDVDALLGGFGARVHWGKLHFLTREQLLDRYPRAADFIRVRRDLDPDGRFLNEHLRPLFA